MGDVTASSPSPEPPSASASSPRGVIFVVTVAATLVAALALRQLAWLAGPVFLALVIVTLIHPVHSWLRHHKAPALLALIGLVLCIYGLVIALVAVIAFSMARFAAILPAYADDANAIIRALTTRLSGLGMGTPQLQAVTAALDLRRIASAVTALFHSMISFGASLIFFLSLLLFKAIDSVRIDSRVARLSVQRPGLAQALRTFAGDTRRYLAVTGIFGLLTGLADALLLWWLGIPLPVLWGLLAAVCNFIPYVGFVIGLIPPALLALLDHGWQTMLLCHRCLHPCEFAADFVDCAPLHRRRSQHVGATGGHCGGVLGWVLGPLGAILSIPITSLLKVLLIDSDPRAQWAAALIGSGHRHRR